MSELEIKETVSSFIKKPAASIGAGTVIDRSAMSSSIIVHRMYAKLAADGIRVTDYQEIKTFGDLLARVSLQSENSQAASFEETVSSGITATTGYEDAEEGIGIDIEEISKMPVTRDFREDHFYTQNFTQEEIAYCILQSNPYASFAGLFAVKEAMVKADNNYRSRAFHNISIDHLAGGRPVHEGFRISISHTDNYAVGFAIKKANGNTGGHSPFDAIPETPGKASDLPLWLISFSILLALFAIVMVLKR